MKSFLMNFIEKIFFYAADDDAHDESFNLLWKIVLKKESLWRVLCTSGCIDGY